MKRIVLASVVVIGIIILLAAWVWFGSATAFEGDRYFLEIPTGSTYEQVLDKIRNEQVLKSPGLFNTIAKQLDYPEKVKAGRYLITKGSGVVAIVRKLRNGQQEPVNLVINKLRTKEDLASFAGRKLEFDSAAMLAFLNNPDSLRPHGLDTNTVMTAILPNTYTYFWNTTPSRVMQKFLAARTAFWTDTRLEKARTLGLTPEQVVSLASIVEEETNKNQEKDTIASVYLNRLKIHMRLGADPTVKFALRDFSLKRIYHKHLAVESPYNTYRVQGLPPGPICTPQTVTIDAVLNAATTKYLYFVASPAFDGTHIFAENFQQHMVNARLYQKKLDEYLKKKNQSEDTGANP